MYVFLPYSINCLPQLNGNLLPASSTLKSDALCSSEQMMATYFVDFISPHSSWIHCFILALIESDCSCTLWNETVPPFNYFVLPKKRVVLKINFHTPYNF
jgi:hypothetical protein